MTGGGSVQGGAAAKPGATAVTRCVLWHAPAGTPPKELLESLDARNVSVEPCTDSFRAMAMVCRLERAGDRRARDAAQTARDPATQNAESPPAALTPKPPRDALVLLLVSPTDLADATAVVEAVKRYAPRTACWWYDHRASPRLRAVVDSDVAAWQRTPPAEPPITPSESPPPAEAGLRSPFLAKPETAPAQPPARTPPLRLTGHDDAPPARTAERPDIDSRIDSPRLILSQEELAMLLADDVRPPTPPGRARGADDADQKRSREGGAGEGGHQ